MTAFKDVNGLTNIKALKIDGASKWLATSSVAAALDTTNAAAIVFSVSNPVFLSATAAVYDLENTLAAKSNQMCFQLIEALARAGILTVYYNGTNKIG